MTAAPEAPRRRATQPLLARFVLRAREQRLRARRLSSAASLAALLLALGGCAGYAPRPLARGADSAHALAQLQVDPRSIPLPRLASQSIDPRRPLDMAEVAALAVLNNPRLRVERDRLGVAHAQAFAAGLLPDPRLATSRDYPGNSAGATSTAFSYGLDFDLGSLLTRPAAQAAARAHVHSVDLQLLWQEWQTASQAQLLYTRLVGLRRQQRLLRAELALARLQLERSRAAAAAGNLPRTDADARLVAVQAIEQRIASGQRSGLAWQSQLHALLGLDAAVPLRLGRLPRLPVHAARQARAALARLADIRPDLRALRAGYASQQQALREAVLAQFPSISVGFTRARDTTDVNTIGFGVSFNLPLFNGARGRIAVQRATRRELYDAYQVRLDQAHAEVDQALRELALLRRRRLQLRAGLPALRAASRDARGALRRGDITLPQALAQRQALLEQRLALQRVEEQRVEQAVTLDLLTGSGLYDPAPSTAAAKPARRDGVPARSTASPSRS